MKMSEAVGLSLASLVLMVCVTSGLGSVATATSGASPTARACQAKDLAIHGGRQGAPFQTVEGTVIIVNISNHQCVVHVGTPISFVQSDGVRINVRDLKASKAISPRLLRAKRSTSVILYWYNWCQANPNPLKISIALAGGVGVVSGPFNGRPNYNAVPGCVNKTRGSTLQLASP
jgi:hypothetical protein